MASAAVSTLTDTEYQQGGDDWEESAGTVQIFGREEETKVLLDAYQDVVAKRKAVTILVHGASGTGKTSLVDLLREPVCERQGYFSAGKFFQEKSETQVPYSAVVDALSDLCEVINQSNDFERRRSKIRKALGAELLLIAKLISSASPFLDEGESDLDTGFKNENASSRVKVAFKAFLQALSSAEHPIVLFFDDIQWMDEGSKELIESFVTDGDLRHTCIVLAYRDEEVQRVNELLNEDIQSRCVDLGVEALDENGVHEMVAGVLRCTSDESLKELSDLIAQRTEGNPFHIHQFIDTIQFEGLLTYLEDSKKWHFDVDDIRKQIMVSDTLADVLSRKIQRVPSHVQQTLKVASFVGFCFREATLVDVLKTVHAKALAQRPPGDNSIAKATSFSLSKALQGGFVERTKTGFQFTHDKVLSSIRSLVTADGAEKLHAAIGSVFLSRGDPESKYHAAHHLNYAPTSSSHREMLPRINLEAARYCKDLSAFRDALRFLKLGLQQLDPTEQWNNENFDLTFEMMEMLAKMELIIGNFEECRELTTQTLSHATSLEMKIPSLLINVEAHMAGNEMDASISSANQALRELGIRMPRRASFGHVLFKLFKVKRMMKGKTNSDILALPVIQDQRMTTASQLLFNICMYCLSKDEENTATYAALLATELTLKEGLSPYSASALSIFGIAELTLGNVDAAYRFGKLSLELLKVVVCKEAECATAVSCLTMLSHWRDPLSELIEPLDKGMQSGFDTGDIVYSIYSASNCITIRINLGHSLSSIEEVMSPIYGRICDFNLDAVKSWVQPSFQYVLNMQLEDADWDDVIKLTGQIMNEDEYMSHADEANHALLILTCLMFKVQLAYNFGFYFAAEAMLERLRQVGQANRHHYSFHSWQLIGALNYFQLYRVTGTRKYLRYARSFTKSFKSLEKLGWPNASSLLSLVLAEEASVKQKDESLIMAEYDKAIDAFKTAELVHLEGLANERAGFFLASVDNLVDARQYFGRAETLYLDKWGAVAKYQWLQEQTRKYSGAKSMRHLVGNVLELSAQESTRT